MASTRRRSPNGRSGTPPQIVLAGPPAAGRGGQERCQDRPLRIAQVGVVAEDCHAPSDGRRPIFQTPAGLHNRV